MREQRFGGGGGHLDSSENGFLDSFLAAKTTFWEKMFRKFQAPKKQIQIHMNCLCFLWWFGWVMDTPPKTKIRIWKSRVWKATSFPKLSFWVPCEFAGVQVDLSPIGRLNHHTVMLLYVLRTIPDSTFTYITSSEDLVSWGQVIRIWMNMIRWYSHDI